MLTLISALLSVLRGLFKAKAALAFENAALRQQLAVYIKNQKHPRLEPADRAFWLVLRRLWSDWARPLVIVQPSTIIGWHRSGFLVLWRRKSKPGRRRIPAKHINFIERISTDHPEWGEGKIAEELIAKFGISHSGSTIRRYVVARSRPPCGGQTWRTFVKNHADQMWSCDFLTQYTALFTVAYETPRFLVHDNDGIPIPYRAPNANAHLERFNRTLREDALDHFIFLGVGHIRKVTAEFIEYYKRARPSQAIHGIPDPYPELTRPLPRDGKLKALPVLGGIQHDYRLAA